MLDWFKAALHKSDPDTTWKTVPPVAVIFPMSTPPPKSGAKCVIGKKIVAIHDAEICKKKFKSNYKPGQIIDIDNYNFIVKTKKGYIKIKELSYLGRHILPAHFSSIYKIKKLAIIK